MKRFSGGFWDWKHWPAVLGSAAIVLGVGVIVNFLSDLMQGPTATEPPNAAEWLSAISTFWGAVATAIGALLTAGALLIAAISFRHQVEERNRMEAERRCKERDARWAHARTVKIAGIEPSAVKNGHVNYRLRNNSDMPVDSVVAVFMNDKGEHVGHPRFIGTLKPKEETLFPVPRSDIRTSYVVFRDADGLTWKLETTGHLEELDASRSMSV